MQIWSAEIKELESLYTSIKGRFPDLEKELDRLVKADDENMVLLYSRRCLEVIISDLCECELNRPRKTEPLKGIIDKLHHEEKVPGYIITSMHGLNDLSTYGAHPKDFDPEQIKPVLNNLTIIIRWYIKYKDFKVIEKTKPEKEVYKRTPIEFPRAEKSIIVLPFENISPDPDQEYFSDGLTEEIITDLSHIHDLLVISRNSAMTFKGTKKKTNEIAREVNVRYVLEGSVRKAGNNLRITAQLIDGLNDSHIWAEKYSGTLDDVFDIQQKVSRAIVAQLKLKLAPNEERLISLPSISSGHAYDAYLRARQEIARWTEPALDRASQQLKKALEIVGDNAAIFACFALLHLTHAFSGFRPLEESLEKAKSYAMQTLEINSEISLAYTVLGIIAYMRGEMRKAFALTKQSVSINPEDADAVLYFVHAGISVGRCPECRLIVKQVIQADPLNSLSHIASAILEFYSGQFKKALKSARIGYELDPNGIFSRCWYCIILSYTKRFDECQAILDKWKEEMPDQFYWQCSFMLQKGIEGNKTEYQTMLQKIVEEHFSYVWNDTVSIWFITDVSALNGESEEALKWLEHGLNIGCINYPFLSRFDPYLESIRSDPRFQKIMERVKYEWDNFEV